MCVQFNGQTFSVFLTVFFYVIFWGVKNAKNDFFKKKMILRVDFIKYTFRWLQTSLSDLKKHQTLEILLIVNFLRILKMMHSSSCSKF